MLSGLSRSSFRLFLSGNGMSFRTGRYFLEAAFLGGLTGLVTAGFEWMIEAMGRVAAKAVSLGGAWAQAILPAVGAVAGAAVGMTMAPSQRQMKRAANKAAKKVGEAVDMLTEAMDF